METERSLNLALAMARAFHGTKFGDVPPMAIKHAKMILASTLASAASGTRIGSACIVRELAKEHGGRAEATVWFDPMKLPVTAVARVNTMLSDAAAFDDSDLRNIVHAGTPITAIGLAIGETTGATGQDVLCAMITGYEAAGRFGTTVQVGIPGVHPSMVSAFGATVAAAKLLGLTPEQMATAIRLTAVTAGGIAIGTYSWAREYQAGNAALSAMNNALAARRGFVVTVNDDILEAQYGFLEVYGNPQVNIKNLTRTPGPDWDIDKHLAIKLLPGAHPIHPTTEAAINAARQANVPPEQVTKILISGPPKWAVTYTQSLPKDMVEAIYSVPYYVASAVADKDFSSIHLTPEKIHSQVIARLMSLVEVDPAPAPAHYDCFWGGTVTIITQSGARYTSTVDAPHGSAPRGIEWNDVDAKYRFLMQKSGMPTKRVEEILNVIHDFEAVKDVSQFTELLH